MTTTMIMMTMFGGDGFCGDTNRCICSFNFAFTSDHPLVAHYEAADDYHANASAHSQAHAHDHANKDKFAWLWCFHMRMLLLVATMVATTMATMVTTTMRQGIVRSGFGWDGIFMRAARWNGPLPAWEALLGGGGLSFIQLTFLNPLSRAHFWVIFQTGSSRILFSTFSIKFMFWSWFWSRQWWRLFVSVINRIVRRKLISPAGLRSRGWRSRYLVIEPPAAREEIKQGSPSTH